MARGAWRIDSWSSAPSQCWSSAAAGQIGWWRSTPSRRWSSAEQRHARTEALLRIRRYDASYSERAALADATRVVLRPLGPGDAGRLAVAFARLSQRTRALRFLGGKSELFSPPTEFRRLEFLLAMRQVRRQLEEALPVGRREEDQGQRDGDAGAIRKAILAIWLRVTRLAGMWEALLE